MSALPPIPLTLAPTEIGVRTHCPYCAFQCGILMGEDLGGGTSRVTGDPNFPVNNGQLCIKGWTSATLLDHPRRVKTPMLRERGEWRAVNWSEAFDFVAEKMLAIREQSGPDSVYWLGSAKFTNEGSYLFRKFAAFWEQAVRDLGGSINEDEPLI